LIRRIAAALAVVAASIAVLVLAGAGGGSSSGRTINVAFDNAFGITQGGDVRVAGVKAGQTTGFSISKGPECQLGQPRTNPPRTCAIVQLTINRSGFQSFRSDANCAIRQQSLIGEYYVDCQPGTAARELPKNATIPDTRTASTIPTDLVGDIMRRPYRDRLRLIINELGTGLAGRPQDIAELLHHASPALQQTDRVLTILANQHQIIQNFIGDSNTVVTQLDDNKSEVARWIAEAGRTAAISATRQADIARGFQRLPRFLDELRPTMQRLGELTDAQTPLLRQLQAAAPSLTQFLSELGPFSQANIPNFRTLGQAGEVGIRAFRDSKQDIDTLNALAKDAPATAKPLRQFLQTLDDRKRSPEPDSRAQPTAPPAGDQTAWIPGKGYTGMEALISYVYVQALAVNQFDPISHVLSTINNVDPICSPYQTAYTLKKNNSVQRCNSYFGPFQPGVTSPDNVTPHGGAGSPASQPQATAAASPAHPLAATKPLPGQTDYSQPHPTLAPSTQQLLQHLQQAPQVQAPSTPSAPGAPATQAPDQNTIANALDYLLAP
jgi:virulence factor Mce-like protein